MHILEQTCTLLSTSQGWEVEKNGWNNGSQSHIQYFASNPYETALLYSRAWYSAISPNALRACDRITTFAKSQSPSARLDIMMAIESLLDHRAFYTRYFSRTVNKYDEIKLSDIQSTLQAVSLLCQSAMYREYMELLSNAKGQTKPGQIWVAFWERQVDAAIQKRDGVVWGLLKGLGYPGETGAVSKVKDVGIALWWRLSEVVHEPELKGVEDRFAEPLGRWEDEERDVLVVIGEMAKEKESVKRVADGTPEWEKRVSWR